ncbi:oligosaccharide flippase family protein [Escherichia coli]|uniref:O49 family O-antigen flippase n=1 Tax=Escherichia coli TaxID=562 RepID=UPI0003EF640A|nr:O49 family O-antigen flippase [Escherichia coli]MCI7751971.1 O49 family O-antigen flippase [Shigella flexneri]EAA1742112.1 polysaccharide biosynthesis protein [Escherichia coli]EAA2354117.1 polysaccharide biosynthesis protein [Escherichia coli]EAC1475593.1 polysaccharide biosynthesis protein [Escherichia coli]EEW3669665.1 polysaccharide biosynthesis protein [Escherichia coli]
MLRRNVVFNYLGQFYISLMGICIFPLYLRYIGEEAYGLIGFFVLLQTWMLLFDLGMSPTLSRQVAITNANNDFDFLRKLMRSLESVFFFIALIIMLLMAIFCNDIAQKWLTVKNLNIDEVAVCIAIMGGVVSLRWFTSLYKSGINGYEKQAWLNVVNIFIVTLRLPASLLLFIYFSKSLIIYFVYQLIISIVELFIYNRKMYRCLPKRLNDNHKIYLISWDILKSVLPFAAGTAYTAGIWVLLTQLDKLLLSKVLTLSNFGFFSLVATLVGGILMLSSPVSNAILPRITVLVSQGKIDQVVGLYTRCTRFVCCVIFPIAMVMICYPYQVIYGWTGNDVTAKWAVNVLPLYSLGNALLAVIGFQYYLQYAYGKLKLHIIYNTVLAIVSIPAVSFFAIRYAAIGTGIVWIAINSITLLFWTYIVHNKFLKGVHFRWLFQDVLFPALISAMIIFIISNNIDTTSQSRIENMLFVSLVSFTTIIISLFVSFFTDIMSFFKGMVK